MLRWIKETFHGSYKGLLLALILLFIFRPYFDSLLYFAIWKLLLTITLITSILSNYHKRIVKITVTVLAIPALLFCWADLFDRTELFFIPNVLLTVLFLTICGTSIVSDVVRRSHVTFETLRGVVSAYFIVSFLFAYIFYLIDCLQPGSIPVSTVPEPFILTHSLSDMLYYSFITLLMFGTIDATNSAAQTVIALEGIVGQFYIAILVAKIVSAYTMSPRRVAALLKKSLDEHE